MHHNIQSDTLCNMKSTDISMENSYSFTKSKLLCKPYKNDVQSALKRYPSIRWADCRKLNIVFFYFSDVDMSNSRSKNFKTKKSVILQTKSYWLSKVTIGMSSCFRDAMSNLVHCKKGHQSVQNEQCRKQSYWDKIIFDFISLKTTELKHIQNSTMVKKH